MRMMMIRIVTLLFLLFSSTVEAATKIAIHATAEEIAIWNQRRVSGPYKDEYDNRILARANSFRSSPTGAWTGASSCGQMAPSGGSTRDRDQGARDAAF